MTQHRSSAASPRRQQLNPAGRGFRIRAKKEMAHFAVNLCRKPLSVTELRRRAGPPRAGGLGLRAEVERTDAGCANYGGYFS